MAVDPVPLGGSGEAATLAEAEAPRRTAHGRGLLRGGALVFGSTLVWHASNFGYNAATAHLLGPVSYGDLTAATGLLALATPVTVAIQTVASRMTTALDATPARVRGLLRFYGLRLTVALVLVSGVLVILSPAVGRFLREPSPWPVALAAIAAAIAFATHLQRGVLQGTQAFGRYALSTIVEAVTKIVLVAALLFAVSRSATSAVAAVVAASCAGVVANWVMLRFLPKPARPERPTSHPYRYSLLTLGTLSLLSLLFSADVLAAKRYLSPHAAGVYSAVSLSGKIVYFATSAISLYLFPLFSSRRDGGLDSRRLLGIAFGLVAAGSVVVIAIYEVAPALVIRPLFGSSYSAAGPHLPLIGLAFGCYAVVYLAASFLLSQGRQMVVVVLAGAFVAQLGALYAFHSTIGQIVDVQAAVFGAAAVSLVAVCVRRVDVTVPSRFSPELL